MKNKLKSFKCHTCNTIILTDKTTVRCENCGSSYVLESENWFKENMWSKWSNQIQGKNEK
ncbi:hypothetical protein ES703_87818 [subsurface metagenome]